VQTLLHWPDCNAVFNVDVSRVYANSLHQKTARSKIKAYTHTAFLKMFRVVQEKRIKNALAIGYQHFKRSPNSSIFVVTANTNHLRNFRSDVLSHLVRR